VFHDPRDNGLARDTISYHRTEATQFDKGLQIILEDSFLQQVSCDERFSIVTWPSCLGSVQQGGRFSVASYGRGALHYVCEVDLLTLAAFLVVVIVVVVVVCIAVAVIWYKIKGEL